MEILLAVLGGSALSTLISQIGEFIRQRKKHDLDMEKKENKDIANLKEAMRYVMLDRIRYLGQVYIKAGAVDFDDRRLLNEMHSCYHKGLEGNGDLDTLMEQVNALPLKT